MIARKRLVGVIDVQSTRSSAFKDYDRAHAAADRRARRGGHRQRPALPPRRAAVPDDSNAFADLARVLVDPRYRRTAEQDRVERARADQLRRVQHSAGGCGRSKSLRHRFSIRYDQRVNIDNIPLGKGITGAAATSREVVRVHDTSTDPRYIASHPGIRSEIAVPLIVQDRVIGVMDLESERIGYFTEDHARTLGLLAPSVAIAVENARLYQEIGERERRMQEDLKAAFELQTVLLPPEAPEVEGLEIAIGLRPAREISGDLYDFFEHGEFACCDRVRRFERQRRGGGALRGDGQRPACAPLRRAAAVRRN